MNDAIEPGWHWIVPHTTLCAPECEECEPEVVFVVAFDERGRRDVWAPGYEDCAVGELCFYGIGSKFAKPVKFYQRWEWVQRVEEPR